MKTIITTGGRPDETSRNLAGIASETLKYPVIERNKRSIARLQHEYKSAVLVAGSNRYDLYRVGMDQPFFFHPNTAAFRIKRLVSGGTDPLIDVTQLRAGESFLDCTLGLASDSIVASFVVGENGKILGVEGDRDVAFLTKSGLSSFSSDSVELVTAMKRVQVVYDDAVSFLRKQHDSSWDIVYIDPMFSAPIKESANFTPLRQVGLKSSLTTEWMEQALRVCKRQVVVKDRFDSHVFEMFGLNRQIRPNTKFHFGYLSK